MASLAIEEWHGVRARRIDDLLDAHVTVGGEGPGRRWRTEAINWALVIRLAAEWQGYLIDVHDQASDWIVSTVGMDSRPGGKLLQSFLTADRKLLTHNPTADYITADFRRFGFKVWDHCAKRDIRTDDRLEKVKLMMRARDGIAHSNEVKLAQLATDGVSLDLQTIKTWRRAVNGLVVTLDKCTSDHLTREFDSRPW